MAAQAAKLEAAEEDADANVEDKDKALVDAEVSACPCLCLFLCLWQCLWLLLCLCLCLCLCRCLYPCLYPCLRLWLWLWLYLCLCLCLHPQICFQDTPTADAEVTAAPTPADNNEVHPPLVSLVRPQDRK